MLEDIHYRTMMAEQEKKLEREQILQLDRSKYFVFEAEVDEFDPATGKKRKKLFVSRYNTAGVDRLERIGRLPKVVPAKNPRHLHIVPKGSK